MPSASQALRTSNRPMHKRPTKKGSTECEEHPGRVDDEREEDEQV